MVSTIHRRSTAERGSQWNKTGLPSSVEPYPHSVCSEPQRERTESRGMMRSAALLVGPLISARAPSRVSVRARRPAAGRPEVQHRPLAGVQCSLEGERATVEPAHSGALSQDPRAQH
jgi:hypothetical protein